MSDLLQIGASGARAFNTALATIGENVSNMSTPGYARRTITTAAGAGGVVVQSINRSWDDYKAAAKRDAASDAASASTYYDWMGKVESAMSDDAAGIGRSATGIFTSGDALAANPGDTSGRKAFLAAIQTTTNAFNATASSLKSASDDVGVTATSSVEAVNATLDNLDNVNSALHAARAGTAGQANLLDQRDKLLDSLSSSIGIDVTLASDGSANVKLAGGGATLAESGGPGARLSLALGTGTNAGRISITAIGTTNETPVADVGGSLGGLVKSADTIATRRVAMDTLATQFATQINSWSAKGLDANGAAGGTLVSGTTAASLALATTDPAKVPAASPAAGTAPAATNGNLLALSSLRGDGGIEKSWGTLVTDHARAVDAAKTSSTAAASRADATAASLADLSSVDLDTEAADLIRFQQAYAGAAKVIQAARETMQAILDVI
ncbi:flagellar hook-associated protein FlgK [Sphingomonas sp.]|uniref:flagellar hook-associated protein FlgK n=1 Tax=Sphingomonas sp. TaxID=28214 RepID=UPI003B007818